jgi:hypothetical protein
MRRLTLFLLCLIVASSSVGGDLYKWVDEKGQVHYSDKPQPGATKMNLPAAQTFASPSAQPPPAQAPVTGLSAVAGKIQIVAPENQQVYWNTEAITVSVQVTPDLGQGDTITFTLDDQKQGPLNSLAATFSNLEKGEHHANAVLNRGDGSSVSAGVVTFYIQHTAKK